MEKQTRVVLYGSSLNMAGIAASLRAYECLEVIRLNPDSTSDRNALCELQPAVIAFDLNDPPIALDPNLLQGCLPLLVGMDPDSNELLVWSSHRQQALTVEDLVYAIHSKNSCSDSERI